MEKTPKYAAPITFKVPIGARNNETTKYVGRILHYLPEEDWTIAGWAAAAQWNTTRLEAPLGIPELLTIFESIMEREHEERKITGCKKEINYTEQTLEDLYNETFPKESWLVEGLIPLDCITGFTGEPKSLKSYLTQSLAMAVATERPYLEHFPVIQGKVLIIDEENSRRHTRKRFEEMQMPSSKNIILLSRQGIRIDNPDSLAVLLRLVGELQPRLIIIDSLTKVHSKNENQSNEMSEALNGIKKLLSAERAVVVIHHNRKAYGQQKRGDGQSIRGSSAIYAEMDAHLSIDRIPRTENVIITPTALRNGKEMDSFCASLLIDDKTGALNFHYMGKPDELKQESEDILKLFSSHDIELGVGECKDLARIKENIVRETLKKLEKDRILASRKTARGKLLYRLVKKELETLPKLADKISSIKSA